MTPNINGTLRAIIDDRTSDPDKVRNAFAFLYRGAQAASGDITDVIAALKKNHPEVAKEFTNVISECFLSGKAFPNGFIPERFISKWSLWGV